VKGFILGPLKRSECELQLLEEGKKVFEKIFYVPIPEVKMEFGNKTRILYKNKDLTKFDFVIPRVPRTYTNLGFIMLNILKEKLYVPIKPESVLISHNKFLTLLALKEAHLPVPETYLTVSRQALENILDDMRFPVVMKLLYGSLGKGVMFADSKESAVSLMDTLERFKEPIFLEEYVPNPGEDIRAFVLGNDVLAAMKRKAKKDERRANIGIGGKGETIKTDSKIRDLTTKAAHVLGMNICGVDLIKAPKQHLIIEANVNVHFDGLQKTACVNIAKHIVEYVKEEREVLGKTKVEKFLRRVKRWVT